MMMFPIHTLVFTLRFVMMGPSFISSDDSFQEVVTFSTIAIQTLFAAVQMFLFVQFCELLWDLHAQTLWKVCLLWIFL